MEMGLRNDFLQNKKDVLDSMRKENSLTEEDLKVIEVAFSKHRQYSKDFPKRMEAAYKFMVLHAYKAMQKHPYLPRSKKNRNDGLDWHLSFYLGLPAIICTDDGEFKKKMKATGSRQANLVLTGKELITRIKDHTLEKLF